MSAQPQFKQAWSILDIARAAEIRMEAFDERAAPTDCEITAGASADWYLVRTYPGDDHRALSWLSRRRFGVFQPMQQRRLKKANEMLVQGLEPAFPGWLFVFCWDIGKMYWRIKSCPGVMDILSDPVTGKPIPIDQPEMTADARGCVYPRIGFVDKLRALSWIYNDRAPAAVNVNGHFGVRAKRQIKHSVHKLGRAERKELQRLKTEAKQRGLWDDDEWEHANRLDPGKRIALLKRDLLARSRCGCSGQPDVNPPGSGRDRTRPAAKA